MTTKNITAIAFKLFAIWLLFQILLQIPIILSTFYSRPQLIEPGSKWPFLAAIAVIIISLFAVYFIFRLADKILSSMPDRTDSFGEIGDVQSFVLQVLGVYFVVSALSYLPVNFLMANYNPALFEEGSSQLLTHKLTLLINIVKLLVGIFFIVKAPFLRDLFFKLRYFGTRPYNK